MLNDLLIFNKIKNGDIQAFELLFRKHYEPLCLFAVRFVGRLDIAEEIVQDVFYTIWAKRGTLQVTASTKSYLYKSVKNRSLQHLSYLGIREKYKDIISEIELRKFASTPISDLEYSELQTCVSSAMSKMPKRRSKIFQMSRIEGKKYATIAEELSLSTKTIEAEISKALEALRKAVKGYKS